MMRAEKAIRRMSQCNNQGENIMRKLTIIAILTVCLSGFAYTTEVTVELKAHYFSPSEQAFKDIYGGGLMYGGEISVGIWGDLDLWFGGSYFSKTGELTFTKEETKLELIPLGVGAKYRILSGNFALYAGLGLNYYQYKETNPIGDASDGGLGFVGKIGSNVAVVGGILIDFYVEYTYCKMKPADFEINVGGIAAGIGVGYRF
jgi:hypothetical protein